MDGLFSRKLWERVNEHFRASGGLYVEAPRSRTYRAKQKRMYQRFPDEADVWTQAAYLAKNLVNLQRYPDANKRTASVLLEVFLEQRGYELDCTDAAYGKFLVDVQHRVPPAAWDGRTFSLKADYVDWREDAYHHRLRDWLKANTKRKP